MMVEAHVAGASETERSVPSMRTAERALNLLRALALARDGITLSAAAREVQLPTSTTSRLLQTLEHTKFAWRDSGGLYRAGTNLLQVGALAMADLPAFRHAEMHLQQVADATGETAYLAIPAGRERALYLKQVESALAIRHAVWAGREIRTSGTALGGALALRANADGYVTSRATAIEPDAAAAAAPVRDANGDVVGAISVIGPSFRIDDERLHALGRIVAQHGREMSAEMGWRAD